MKITTYVIFTIVTIVVVLIQCISCMDPYATLGVSRDASLQEIKKAYKQKALQWHPDKNKDPNANEKFMEITNAYEMLTTDDLEFKFTPPFQSTFRPRQPPTEIGGGTIAIILVVILAIRYALTSRTPQAPSAPQVIMYQTPSFFGRVFGGFIDSTIWKAQLDVVWKMLQLLQAGKVTSILSPSLFIVALYSFSLYKGYTVGKFIMRLKVIPGDQPPTSTVPVATVKGLRFVIREIISKQFLLPLDFFSWMFTDKSITDRIFNTKLVK